VAVNDAVDGVGSLQSNPVVLDEIEAIITASPVRYRAGGTAPVRVTAPQLVLLGEPITVAVDVEPDSSGRVPAVRITLTSAEPATANQASIAPAAHPRPTRRHHLHFGCERVDGCAAFADRPRKRLQCKPKRSGAS
jgi:hypothetical protein